MHRGTRTSRCIPDSLTRRISMAHARNSFWVHLFCNRHCALVFGGSMQVSNHFTSSTVAIAATGGAYVRGVCDSNYFARCTAQS